MLLLQCVRFVQRRLAGLHGVDKVAFDGLEILAGQRAGEDINAGGADQGSLAAGDHLDALSAGVGALVVLAGQGFHSQNSGSFRQCGQFFIIAEVALRFRKYAAAGCLVGGPVDALRVVAVEQAHAGQVRHAQGTGQILEQGLCLHVKAVPLFRVASKYMCHKDSP